LEQSEILLTPIGKIMTPFATISNGIPIQGRMASDTSGTVKVFPEYKEGLRDLDGFSHVILVYFFHQSNSVKLTAKPYMDTCQRGIFSIRSPHRPNHIGITLVELVKIDDDTLYIKGVDMVNETPLLDIKPYSPSFDMAVEVRTGWMEQFLNGKRSKRMTIVNNEEDWLHLK